MLCNRLTELTNALVQLSVHTSLLDITRTVCGCCDRRERCPSLTVEQAESMERKQPEWSISRQLVAEPG